MKRGKKAQEPFLWPVPKKATWTGETTGIPEVMTASSEVTITESARRAWLGLNRIAGINEKECQPIEEKRGATWLQIKQVSDLPDEGYRLTIGIRNVSIEASTPLGVKFGIYTVSWLWQKPTGLPIGRVEDWPDFAVRGFMLDISRGKVPMGFNLYELLMVLAGLKYNHLQLYTEHTFAFHEHKAVWADASPLAAENVKLLQHYCEQFGVELSANLNSFGHFERWLKHPEYKHLAECPNGFEHPIKGKVPHGTTLRPNAASLKFLDKLWAEYLPLFKSKRFNLGGDEPWELGQGWSKPLVKKYGKHRVYLDFLKRLHKQAKKHGKEMLFWGDILLESPELVKEVPRDATALLWGYEAYHPFAEQCAKLAKAKRKFWVCPGTSAWNTFTGRTDNMLANIESAAKHGLANRAKGFLLTSWGDGGNHQPRPLMNAGIVYGAGAAWNVKGTRGDKLQRAIDQHFWCNWLGKSLLEIGCVENGIKRPLPNRSRLHNLFFADRAGLKKECETLTVKELVTATTNLKRVRRNLPETKLARSLDILYGADHELRLGIDMAAWAVKRALLFKADKKDPALREELNALIERFEKAWVWHARPGGLPEAVARMRAVEKEL